MLSYTTNGANFHYDLYKARNNCFLFDDWLDRVVHGKYIFDYNDNNLQHINTSDLIFLSDTLERCSMLGQMFYLVSFGGTEQSIEYNSHILLLCWEVCYKLLNLTLVSKSSWLNRSRKYILERSGEMSRSIQQPILLWAAVRKQIIKHIGILLLYYNMLIHKI